LDIQIEATTFDEIEGEVRRHLAALPSAIDSFLEDHILASTHYRLLAGGAEAGFASIHGERLITQFAVAKPYRRYGQPFFDRLRRMEQVQAAFVPTCDEFFLAHALDDYRQLAKQAYFFAESSDMMLPSGLTVRPAEPGDEELVRRESGEFFDSIDRHIERGELFVTLRGDEPVGFGLLIESALYDDVASIGMFTIERFRREGVGTATIALLIAACRRRGLRPVAGCWYYNHRSKRTLERAGMYSATRLLKVDY
jgi:RimJ/RimL family protein N-acetyltransferase